MDTSHTDLNGIEDADLRETRPTETHLTDTHDVTTGLADTDVERTNDRLATTVERDDDLLRDGDHIIARGERLVPGVEQVELSRVRVTRRIVTEERQITVPVQREELVVEYLDDAAGQQAHNPVRGSTESVDSRVAEEYVLHEMVPRVVFDMVPRERVRLLVDTQRSLVQVTEPVSREHIEVTGAEPTDLADPAR